MNAGVKTLYGVQMMTAVLSCTGSTTVAIMIIRSEPKLESPSRRLIFGLSISDILQSLPLVFGPLTTAPTENGIKLFDIGTQTTCNVTGFTFNFGSMTCASYTLFLSIYYLHAVKYKKPDKEFCNKIEKKLHFFGILYALTISLIHLFLGNYNNIFHGSNCFTVERPVGCHLNPDVECERGEYAQTLSIFLSVIPVICMSLGIVYSLGSLYLFVKADGERQQRRFTTSLMMNSRLSSESKHSFSRRLSSIVIPSIRLPSIRRSALKTSGTTKPGEELDEEEEEIKNIVSRLEGNIEEGGPTSMSANVFPVSTPTQYVTRAERRSESVRRQTLAQALLYGGAYFFVYTMPILAMSIWIRNGKNPPIGFLIGLNTVFPLQGLLNIFIYTRPQVRTLRVRHPEFSWRQAMREVVKAGGEVPPKYQRRRRNKGPVQLRRTG